MSTGSIELSLFINEDEEYTVSDDRDTAHEQYVENFNGPYLEYTINIEGIPLPEARVLRIDLSKAVKDDDGGLSLTVTATQR